MLTDFRHSVRVLLRNPLVQQAILRATQKRIGLLAVPALQTVAELSSGARSEYVRLEASKDLLDRAGFQPPERVDHRIRRAPDGPYRPQLRGGQNPASSRVTSPQHAIFLSKVRFTFGQCSS